MENEGFEVFGFDNLEDLPMLLKAGMEWAAIAQSGDTEKAKEWFKNAHPKVRMSFMANKHMQFCEQENNWESMLSDLVAMGIDIPPTLATNILMLHEALHAKMQEAKELLENPPAALPTPTISPEEDATAFRIFSGVFPKKEEDDNGYWV